MGMVARHIGSAAAIAALCAITGATHLRAQSAVAAAATEISEALEPELYAAARQYFPGDVSAVPAKRIFRLTRDQIDATLSSLLPAYVPRSVKAVMPKDGLQTNYEYAELLNLNGANIGALSGLLSEIATRVRQDPAGVVNCAASSNSAECLTAAARDFIVRAFRGDVTEDKIAAITGFYLAGVKNAGFNQATGDLVEVVLNSPHFLFRKEIDVSRTGRLAPAQLLQAVTYTVADAPPEKLKLRSQDASQYLRSGKEAGATISAIIMAKEAREKLVRFITAWLEIKSPGDFTISAKVFPEFTATLEAAMLDETAQFLRAQLMKPAPSLKDITQATQTVASKRVASIYGTQSDAGNAAKPLNLDPAQRLGIFSQPAVIASHSGPTDTRPIKRGVFWVRKAMCMEMEPPPKELHATLYDLAGATEREKIEKSTGGAACIGCHKVINPFAFFQENYDALGRWRTLDNGAPIDPSILINFLDEEPVKTTGPVDALKTLTSSLMFKQCFVRQMFRFYMGRTEEPADDPLLRDIFLVFAHKDKQDIVRAVQMLVSSDRIVRRQ
jgi:Protein of unknown function (DUF1588)/Protein of unknown function (DUF1592)/Protein of unknown function (DUF1595)